MIRRLAPVFALSLLALISAPQVFAQSSAREEARLIEAAGVLEELRMSRDQFVPDRLLERAYGIAIIPNVVKGGLGIGARFGRGVLVVRDKDGRFTNPVFIQIAGGSFGWQIGVQSIDVVLVFTTRRGIEGITDGKLTLGADAAVAAGPVGRQASASTDASFTAEVYSYSRARGLFAGVALDGTALTIDGRANRRFYKQRVSASDIMSAQVSTDADAARRLLRAVQLSTASSTPAPTAAPAPAAQPAPMDSTPPPSGTSEATTFPMADPAPGAEPPR
ncbi:MAG TPA: lipid-binding SYLF domain-containing protein [Steroidobacteraceae bacterium]|nr:lipid-binding SYLF domain-containing protein [Steroidobacteraceae bacterium]